MKRDVARVLAALLDIVVPARCAGCGAVGEGLCASCRAEIELAEPVVVRLTGNLATLTAAGRYAGALRCAIIALKYGNRRSLAGTLAAVLARHVVIGDSLVVPVPLHPARERERGYNQAQLLAYELRRALRGADARVVADALVRVRATRVQSKLKAVARKANVNGAFAPGPGAGVVRGRRIALVDDVFTTGATLHACAGALKRAGALAIDAVCVAVR